MVDDNLVKQLLAEWLVHFGTREVDIDETLGKLSDIYNNNDIWHYAIDERDYIHYDYQRETWQLTDAGIKHLQ
jgi:hypothetical protein